MVLEDWHKEHWIKTVSREAFVEWCGVNKPEYTAEYAGSIHDAYVVPKEPETPVEPPAKGKKNDKKGVYVDTEQE